MIAATIAQEGEGLAPFKWASTALTYRIADGFSQAELSAIAYAGAWWARVANIKWEYSDDPVIWVRPAEKPAAYLPNETENGGDVFLPNPQAITGFDIFNALHEIGHALGLTHNNDKSVMNTGLAYLPWARPLAPTAIDIERVNDMYGDISIVGVADDLG